LTDEATGERGKLVRNFTVNSKIYAGGCIAIGGASGVPRGAFGGIPKAHQNRAKLNPNVKTVINC